MTYEELIALEGIKQSESSPDIIKSHETVARLLVPEYIDEDGSVLPSAFFHIVKFNEVSILRCEYDFELNKEITVNQLMRNPKNIYRGYITTRVDNLKNLLYEKSHYRVCYIVDSATQEKKGHADIKGLAAQIISEITTLNLSEKNLKKIIQKKIWEVFEQKIQNYHPEP